MGLTTKKLKYTELEYSLGWEGETVTGKYYPGVWTGEYVEKLGEETLYNSVSQLLVPGSWDFTFAEDDEEIEPELRGKPVPTTPEALAKYAPIGFLRALLSHLMDLMRAPN